MINDKKIICIYYYYHLQFFYNNLELKKGTSLFYKEIVIELIHFLFLKEQIPFCMNYVSNITLVPIVFLLSRNFDSGFNTVLSNKQKYIDSGS